MGLHQSQVHSWNGLHHHLTLTMMSLHFSMKAQQEAQVEMPLMSISDIKLIFAKKLQNKLNSNDGILNAIKRRHQ